MKFLFRAAFAAPLIFGLASGAHASVTLPEIHPGFWKSSMVMVMNMKGQPPDTDTAPTLQYNCYTAADIDKGMKLLTGGMGMGCTVDLEGSGGSYTLAMSCPDPTGGTGKIISNGTMTFDGNTAFHMAETMSSNIANMQMTGNTTVDAKWMGACPAGVAPGDYGNIQNGIFQKRGNFDTPSAPGQ